MSKPTSVAKTEAEPREISLHALRCNLAMLQLLARAESSADHGAINEALNHEAWYAIDMLLGDVRKDLDALAKGTAVAR